MRITSAAARAAPWPVPPCGRAGEARVSLAIGEGAVPIRAGDWREVAEALRLFRGRAPRRLALEVQHALALFPPDIDNQDEQQTEQQAVHQRREGATFVQRDRRVDGELT